jgi:hypothetical protein
LASIAAAHVGELGITPDVVLDVRLLAATETFTKVVGDLG